MRTATTLAARVNIYALALLDDAPFNPEIPAITCGALAAHEVDMLERRERTRDDARRVEDVLSRIGVSL